MALTQKQIEKMVSSPSVGVVTYQAHALTSELSRINDKEYLAEACKIRDVFSCIAEYVLEELWDLQQAVEKSDLQSRTWAWCFTISIPTYGTCGQVLRSSLRPEFRWP